jgi:hypothetical protein
MSNVYDGLTRQAANGLHLLCPFETPHFVYCVLSEHHTNFFTINIATSPTPVYLSITTLAQDRDACLFSL